MEMPAAECKPPERTMPNEAPFDPCKQWLGIDAVDLGNPRIVLGISPRETDPRAVLRAAEARLSLLRTISPGPFEMARAALLTRVEEAREKLLADIAAGVPSPPGGNAGGFAMPSPPSQRAGGPLLQHPASTFAVPVAPGVVPPTVPRAVMPPVPSPMPTGDFGRDNGGVETIAIRTVVYRKQTPVAGIAMTVLALAAVAGGLVYYTYYGKRKGKQSAGRQTAQAERKVSEPVKDPAKSDREELKPRPTRRDQAAVPEDATSDRAVSSSPPPSKRTPRPRPTRPEMDPLQESPAEELVPDAMPPVPMRKPDTRMADEGRSVEDSPPKAPVDEEPVELSVTQGGTLDTTLAKSLESLRRQEDDTVRRLLAEASKEAQGGEARRRVASWQQLAAYYKGFLDYREKALAAVKAGDEYDVKNQKIVVVEADDDTFVYRAAGGNKTVAREKIPALIKLAIVTRWFDDNPANDLYIGAYHLAKPEPDRQLAREHWERAAAAGADASGLMPLLADPLFVAAE